MDGELGLLPPEYLVFGTLTARLQHLGQQLAQGFRVGVLEQRIHEQPLSLAGISLQHQLGTTFLQLLVLHRTLIEIEHFGGG